MWFQDAHNKFTTLCKVIANFELRVVWGTMINIAKRRVLLQFVTARGDGGFDNSAPWGDAVREACYLI